MCVYVCTDALQAGASQFEASAGKLKRKFWWKNMKASIAVSCSVLILMCGVYPLFSVLRCRYKLWIQTFFEFILIV